MIRLLIAALLFSVSNVSWSQCVRGNCDTGQGALTWPDGQKYVGEFRNGKISGQGTYTWLSGQKYVGEFRNGKMSGQGTRTWPSGQKYVGEWKDGERNGQGISTTSDGARLLLVYADGEIVSEEKLTPKKISEIVQEQMASAHNLLSALGYGVGSAANLPNPLLISAVNSYCSANEAELSSCPDLNEIQLDFDDFLKALQTSIANRQTRLKSATIIGSGSAFRLNAEGSLATSSHVINNCLAISDSDGNYYKTTINNQVQDLAVLDLELDVTNSSNTNVQFAKLSDEDIDLGQSVFVAGFPYSSLLKSLNFTEGSVSSLSGIGGNTQHFQITAPMQPGNSGGPILSEDGAVVGIAVGKLDEEVMAKLGAGLPQNVNFGIDAQILKKILDNNSIHYEEGNPFFSFMSSREKVANHALQVTEKITCWGDD